MVEYTYVWLAIYQVASLLYSLSIYQLVRVHVVIPPQLLSTYRPIAILNDLQHIPHQPSSSLLAYHIDHDHSVSSNPRLVRVLESDVDLIMCH